MLFRALSHPAWIESLWTPNLARICSILNLLTCICLTSSFAGNCSCFGGVAPKLHRARCLNDKARDLQHEEACHVDTEPLPNARIKFPRNEKSSSLINGGFNQRINEPLQYLANHIARTVRQGALLSSARSSPSDLVMLYTCREQDEIVPVRYIPHFFRCMLEGVWAMSSSLVPCMAFVNLALPVRIDLTVGGVLTWIRFGTADRADEISIQIHSKGGVVANVTAVLTSIHRVGTAWNPFASCCLHVLEHVLSRNSASSRPTCCNSVLRPLRTRFLAEDLIKPFRVSTSRRITLVTTGWPRHCVEP